MPFFLLSPILALKSLVMFVKRNRTQHGNKRYGSVLLVQGRRVAAKRKRGRPAAQAVTPQSVVIHQTLANLSELPEELINLIEAYCLRDLPGAQAAIQHICEAPNTSSSKIVAAMNQLAEWHLTVGHDPQAAREIFKDIQERFSETEHAHYAAQRLAQLTPRSEKGVGQNGNNGNDEPNHARQNHPNLELSQGRARVERGRELI